jgi:hypothetical protein
VKQVRRKLHVGDVVEIRPGDDSAVLAQVHALLKQLHEQHLSAVPVGTLLKDSGTPD